MRRDDQWFEPGDKVMKVGEYAGQPGDIKSETPWGVVLCVTDFWEQDDGNLVVFVGYPVTVDAVGNEWWDCANCYRKVEEIKLCAQAVSKTTKPTIQPEEVPS